MTLIEYFDRLEMHDWYHEFSDSHSTWTKGQKDLEELKCYRKFGDKYDKMFQDFKAYHFSGDMFDTPKAPKPLLENYL